MPSYLEVDLTLPFDPVDHEQWDKYRATGMTEAETARQLAQDRLGFMGAEVRHATRVNW